MSDRSFEIMVFIVSRLMEDPRALENVERLVGELRSNGVPVEDSHRVINRLMTALGEVRGGVPIAETMSMRASVHVFDRQDQANLPLEAQGFLIELRELGLLDDLQVEEVVERALYRGSDPLERRELQAIVAEVLLHSAAESTEGMPHWSTLDGEEGAIH
jgi:uncharacterized protein Smg (DUF494 family)